MASPEVVELGSRYRNTLTELGPITYAASQTVTLRLPTSWLHRAITLRFRGTLTVGTATATAINEGLLKLISKVELIGDGRKTYIAASGQDLAKLSAVVMGQHGEYQPPLLTVGANTFAASFQIHNEAAAMQRPYDSFLDSRRHDILELRITFGADTDAFTPGAMGTAVVSGSVDVLLEQTTDGANLVQFNRLVMFREDTITATSSALQIEVPRNGLLAGILFRTSRNAQPVNDIINRITLKSDSQFLHADALRWNTLRAKNVIEYHQQRPFSAFAAAGYGATYDPNLWGSGWDGYAFLPLAEDGMISSCLNTLQLNQLDVILDVTFGAGTQIVRQTYVFFEPRDAG